MTEQRSSRPGPALVRRAYRKLVYRRIELIRYEVRAGDSHPPGPNPTFEIEILGPERLDEVRGTNPHLTDSDIDRMRDQGGRCIVALDDGSLAASSWMLASSVYVTELHRVVEASQDDHYSCRSFVDPRWRGAGLLSHMLHHYATAQSPTDRIWGYVYAWNVASSRSLEKIGWRRAGRAWTTFVLTRQRGGEEDLPAVTR